MVSCVVVDDDPETVSSFCELLDMIGLDVLITGSNGKDAVDMYEKHRPDLIFINLIMLKYDGFFAIDGINKINDSAKIVAVTVDTTDTYGKLNNLHISILSKPYTMETLRKIVDEELLQNQ